MIHEYSKYLEQEFKFVFKEKARKSLRKNKSKLKKLVAEQTVYKIHRCMFKSGSLSQSTLQKVVANNRKEIRNLERLIRCDKYYLKTGYVSPEGF